MFSFSPAAASYVRFVVGSDWGNTVFTGFSEAQFDGTPATPPTTTPEPASILGLLAVGGGLLATKRRKG